MPRTIEDVCQEAINRLKASQTRCADVETSGLDFLSNHIVGYVLTFGPAPADSYYLPFRHAPGGNIGGQPGPQTATGWDGVLHPAEQEIITELDRPGTLLFGHNVGFDLKFMMMCGLSGSARIEDTMINAPLLYEYEARYSLEYLAGCAKVEAKKGHVLYEHIAGLFGCDATQKAAMPHYWRLSGDDPVAVEYAAGDGTSTWQLRDWQMPQLAAEGLLTVHDIESRMIPILARMSLRGIKVDLERFERLQEFVKQRIEELMNTFPSGFNVKSPADAYEWMVTKHGHMDYPLTPKGKPSMVQAWLEQHPAGQQIVEVRKLRTLQGSFIDPLLGRHLRNGRIHTNYNQLKGDEFGTITGRLSSNDPNLHAVPKHDEFVGRLFRDIYVPDYDVWGEVDYSQCEPRLLGLYSGCRVLLDGYRADPPIDAHTSVSAAVMGDKWNVMSKTEQKQFRNDFGKRINQTILTGGGERALTTRYKMTSEGARQAMQTYFRAMPEVKALQKAATAKMRLNGFVRDILGRKARYDGERAYVAVNRLLQCGNASIIKLKMVRIDDYLASQGVDDRFNVLNNCHDALSFQFHDDPEGWALYKECQRIMTDFGPDELFQIKYGDEEIPIVVDAGEGPTWALATYGPEK